jgi:hypothetical protein
MTRGALFLLIVAVGCSDRIQPSGSTLVKDVPPPPPPPPDEDASGPGYDAGARDGYVPVDANYGACAGCVCAPETSYCFAGATPRADALDAAPPPVCTTASGSPPQVGCNTVPAACAAKPTCACIIDTLQPLYRCYLNCRDDGDQKLVYCPNP